MNSAEVQLRQQLEEAEKRIDILERALKPLAELCKYAEDQGDFKTVSVHVWKIREARAALQLRPAE